MVGLLIDYLYQLDYDDVLPVQEPIVEETTSRTHAPADIEVLPADPVPASTELDTRVMDPAPTEESGWSFEVAVVPEVCDVWSFGGGVSKKKKKKKKAAGRLHLPGSSVDIPMHRLTVNALIYAMADRYGIKDLMLLAQTKFATAAAQDWESCAFVRAAALVFDTTPSSDLGLRNIVIETIATHRRLVDYVEIADLLDSGNGIAWLLLQYCWRDE